MYRDRIETIRDDLTLSKFPTLDECRFLLAHIDKLEAELRKGIQLLEKVVGNSQHADTPIHYELLYDTNTFFKKRKGD